MWLGVLKMWFLGHAPYKTPCCNNPHGTQLTLVLNRLKVGVGGTCLLQKESTTPHPGSSKHSLQYDRRPDWHLECGLGWHIGVQVGT